MDLETLSKLIEDRLVIGYSRYGKGLLHPSNDTLDFKQEALEEALDFVIYASANAVRKTPMVSLKLDLEHDSNDDPKVSAKLVVNYEMINDGNDAVLKNILNQMSREYKYNDDDMTPENMIMLVGLSALSSCLTN